jgi:predicted amidophosphoribosyltransferase
MAIAIKPRKLTGPWAEGYALDVHTTQSVFLGYNAYGHPVFDTARSPLGDLCYRLKYRGDQSVLDDIAGTVGRFLSKWSPSVEALVPVPPSNIARKRQPVLEIAKTVCASAGIALCDTCIAKTKGTPQLKNSSKTPSRWIRIRRVAAACCSSTTSTDRAPPPGRSRSFSWGKARPRRSIC